MGRESLRPAPRGDATGNTNGENFALNHNLICARYYAWLVSLTNTLTSTTSLPNFQNTNAVLGTFFTLGNWIIAAR